MDMDAQKINSLNVSEDILRSYLTGDLIRIADAVGVRTAIQIACALPFAVLAFASRSEPDQRLVNLLGQGKARQIAEAVGGDHLRYVIVPRRIFSQKAIRRLEQLHFSNQRLAEAEGKL